jgi:hypothetical protein
MDGMLAQLVGEVMTGMVDLALVGRPQSGFDQKKMRINPREACKEN